MTSTKVIAVTSNYSGTVAGLAPDFVSLVSAELIGAGGNGGSTLQPGGGGGAGGGYAESLGSPGGNFQGMLPTDSINIQIGVGGGTIGSSFSPGTADTNFKNISQSVAGYAPGGHSATTRTGGTAASAGLGDVTNLGGNGGTAANSSSPASAGGGGAGGPNGNGNNGGSVGSSGTVGGTGGQGDGTSGGLGGAQTVNGSPGAEWSLTAGGTAGVGGGGGGGDDNGNSGGNGGNYGAGGGGSGNLSGRGLGANGVVIITYIASGYSVTDLGSASTTSAPTISISVGVTIPAGTVIYALVNDGGGSNGTLSDGSNTYNIGNAVGSGFQSYYFYYGSNTPIVNLTYTLSASPHNAVMAAMSFTGSNGTYDSAAANNGLFLGVGSITSGTPVGPNEIFIGGVAWSGAATFTQSGGGWRLPPDGVTAGTGGTEIQVAGGFLTPGGSSAQSYGPALSSGTGHILIDAFVVFGGSMPPLGIAMQLLAM